MSLGTVIGQAILASGLFLFAIFIWVRQKQRWWVSLLFVIIGSLFLAASMARNALVTQPLLGLEESYFIWGLDY